MAQSVLVPKRRTQRPMHPARRRPLAAQLLPRAFDRLECAVHR